MIKQLLTGILGLSVLNHNSQVAPNIDWVKYKSERSQISNVPSAIDANNNAFITGYMYVTPSNANANTVKYDPLGVELWTASYDNGGFDNSKAIVIDALGNSYVAGESDGIGTARDIITVKYDPNGVQIWAKRFNGASNGNDVGNSIVLDGSGNVFVTGYTTNMAGNRDYVTLKYDASGNQQFAVIYAGAGNGNDEAVGIAVSNNRVYVTGTSVNASGNSDLVTLRLNQNTGATQWIKSINGTANSNDVSYSLLAYNNDVVVVGQIDNTATGHDYVTTYYNGNNGNISWQKTYDFTNTNGFATALCVNATGNFAVTGVVSNGGLIEYHTLLYNTSGTQLWINKVNTNLSGVNANPQIAVDPIANHFYVSGEKLGVNSDILVYQITPSGNKTWEETFNGAQNSVDGAVDLVVNSMGVIYVAGASLNSNAKFDYTTIKISQTPVYFPTDLVAQNPSKQHLFLKNEGQIMTTGYTTAKNVLFGTINQYPDVYIQKNSFSYVFQKEDTIQTTQDSIERIDVNFLGGIANPRHYEYKPNGINYNYYLGHADNQFISDLKGHERVFVPNYYPNIDLHYYSNKDGLKFYFVVKPNAKVDQILLNLSGALATNINGNGGLFIDGAMGDIELNRPVAYNVNMMGVPIPLVGNSNWTNPSGNNYKVTPTSYNPSLPLVIQITTKSTVNTANSAQANLDYSTYYGGSANDVFNDVAVASNGDRYVTGFTTSGLFPPVNSQNFYNGSTDVVLLKYTADDTLRYATFQGGSAQDLGNTVAINSLNEVFIGGQTFSTDMNGLNVSGATNQFANGGASSSFKADGFIVKMVSVGVPQNNTLSWRRYFGGSGSETINSIFIDGSNNIYIAGYSSSYDCPVVNAFKATLSPTTTTNPSNFDAIFGKFNSSLTAQWITYYGGSNNGSVGTVTNDWGNDIVVDNSGNVIGCGFTDANDLQTTNTTGNTNAFFDNTVGGFSDGFLVRYNSGGTPDYSTYFGGSNSDALLRLVYNSNLNEIYFAGNSRPGVGFPFVNKAGATNSQYSAGGSTSFVGYVSGNLTKQWCSYYGKGQVGTKLYSTFGLSVDNLGVVYLSGYTNSDTLQSPIITPTTSVYTDNTLSAEDGFIAIFSPNKTLFHAHYFGGVGNERIYNSDISQNQRLYVTGYTQSNNFPFAYNPTSATLIDSTYNAGQDGFISRFQLANYQVVGVKEYDFNNSNLLLYPNPSNNEFNLELKEVPNNVTTLKVYTTLGQLIFEKVISDKNTRINCQSWANGVYLLSLNNNSEQKSFKLIKE